MTSSGTKNSINIVEATKAMSNEFGHAGRHATSAEKRERERERAEKQLYLKIDCATAE